MSAKHHFADRTNQGRLKCYRLGERKERRFLLEDLLAYAPSVNIDISEAGLIAGAVNRNDSDLQCGHPHYCSQYRNTGEQWTMLKPHLLNHLEPGAVTVYLYDGGVQRIEDWLAGEGHSSTSLQAQGILRLIPADSIYLEGGVKLVGCSSFWKSIISNCEALGVERLLITGEMNWATSEAPGTELLLQYEQALDDIAAQYPWLTLLCQYDLTRFSAATVFDTLLIHPCVQLEQSSATGLVVQS
uniref:DNA binding protein containing MEthanogen/methylotroph, DcmR Sensory domain (MEDS) n=1 Tax=Alteromonadaceae bacterium PE-TB08W TaxID=1199097 RepID=A0A3G9E9A2_9ALTE|nr:DNA binding protein containing MEthanogen/methylotroph, DcmR Sensory domain (MEDS) [Alteromonadaceae bacterium PE-TB08W]